MYVCVFPPNDTSRFSISSVWLLSHNRKSPLSLNGKPAGQKWRKSTCYTVLFQGKAMLCFAFYLHCQPYCSPSHIKHMELTTYCRFSNISERILLSESAWVNYWLNIRKTILLSVYMLFTVIFPLLFYVSQLFFDLKPMACTNWNDFR